MPGLRRLLDFARVELLYAVYRVGRWQQRHTRYRATRYR